MVKKPSFEGEWLTTRMIAFELNYSPVYFIQKAKKLVKDGIFIEGHHFFKSGSANSCSYQWNLPRIAETFPKWKAQAPTREVQNAK